MKRKGVVFVIAWLLSTVAMSQVAASSPLTLDQLRTKRDELAAWRDRLQVKERAFAPPATSDQLVEIVALEKEAAVQTQRAQNLRQQVSLLEDVLETVTTNKALRGHARRYSHSSATTVRLEKLNQATKVFATPDDKGEAVTSLDKGIWVAALGNADPQGWVLVGFGKGSWGFLRMTLLGY